MRRCWMEGGTSCTHFAWREVGYTERFFWNGGVGWWVWAGDGAPPQHLPQGAVLEGDPDKEDRWWFRFGYGPGASPEQAQAAERQLHTHLRASHARLERKSA